MEITWQEITEGFSSQVHFCEGYTDLYFALYQILEGYAAADRMNPSAAQAAFRDCIENAWAERPLSGSLEASLLVPAAIHAAVLMDDPAAQALRPFYATVEGSFDLESDFPAFEAALTHLFLQGGEVMPWFLREGRVQTNETSRGIGWLLPAYVIQSWQPDVSFTLVDLGTSAGLNLSADYQNWQWTIDGEIVRVNGSPPLAEQFVYSEDPDDPGVQSVVNGRSLKIMQRFGFDQNPLDIFDDGHLLALRACIWGDQPERITRFDQAVAGYKAMMQAGVTPRFYAGDIIEAARLLPNLIPEDIPKPHVLLVFNSAVTTYLNDADYERLRNHLMHSFQRLPEGVVGMWLELEAPRYNESLERKKHFLLRSRVSAFGGVSSFYLGELEPHPTHLYVRPGWHPLRELLGLA